MKKIFPVHNYRFEKPPPPPEKIMKKRVKRQPMPDPDPLRQAASLKRAVIPRRVLEQWPMMSAGMLQSSAQHPLDSLPIDHGVKAVARTGGSAAAEERFLAKTAFAAARK